MNITEAKYGPANIIECKIDGVPCGVPVDPANRHYAEIMRQVEAGELVIAEPD